MSEGARRLVAIVVALALVIGALLWRARRDNRASTTTTTTTTTITPSIVCATELETVCREVFGTGARIEPAGVTARAADQPDVWLTLDPWPTVAGRTGDAVASTRVGLVAPHDRLQVLQNHCTGQKLWACIGDVSGQAWTDIGGNELWGQIHPGYVRPDQSATGYATFASALVAKLGSTTFGNPDLDKIRNWGRQLEADLPTIGPTEPAPIDLLQLTVPRFDLVGVLESQAPAPLRPGLDVLYPEPVANVSVIAVTRGGAPERDRLDRALQKHGWTVPPAAPSGLPDPNLAEPVLAFWKDVKGQ